ncbi:hypothetical protein [Agromyces albus]|uniref:hypothetical protein n=1 Tax=Agromyces albus TaxID=205332 RepID=UPI00278AD500|nr:hypothetical protein [Agromyces albus]MDQ0577236.1 hypothetical protein [Agromyces albus]
MDDRFRYDGGAQPLSLMGTADYFKSPPCALYLGKHCRAGAFCPAATHTEDCEPCRSSTIFLIPAILTTAGPVAPDTKPGWL